MTKPWLPIALLAAACSSSADVTIVDIGKRCMAASDCEHLCVGSPGTTTGQCSIECSTDADCPSIAPCEQTTSGNRCVATGLVVSPIHVRCANACRDVDYFCTEETITTTITTACETWCSQATDGMRMDLIECVDSTPRYTTACPAASCVLERVP